MTSPDQDQDHLPTPSAEAMVAGTMALMTGFAQSPAHCPHRPLLAKKIISNLFFLAGHPALSEALRATMANLRTRWQLEEHTAGPALPSSEVTSFHHPAPGALQ